MEQKIRRGEKKKVLGIYIALKSKGIFQKMMNEKTDNGKVLWLGPEGPQPKNFQLPVFFFTF